MNGERVPPAEAQPAGSSPRLPPLPKPKPATSAVVARGSSPPPQQQQQQPQGGEAACPPPATTQQGGSLPPQPRASDLPLTFTSPFTAGAELRAGGGGPATQPPPPPPHGADSGELDSGSRRPSGVLRSSGSGPRQMRRTVSWSDFDNQAPLAQVVEYEPSEHHSQRSDDEWGSQREGCLCAIM